MGNLLNLMRGIGDDQFEPWPILGFRAISGQTRWKAIHKKLIATGRFQLLSMVVCIAIYKKGILSGRFTLFSILTCGVISDYICHRLISEKRIPSDPFDSLPEDLLCTILSKLPLDEAVRTSAVSRKWRFLWTVCPNLRFEGITMCGKEQDVQKFIDNVNAVLAQCHGSFFDELAIKFDFDTLLVDHLNNWARFAASSRIKYLTFDLAPERFGGRYDRYLFPFQLLDSGSISRLQKIHLSFGYLQPPTGFSGFPNLRKLDLNLVNVTAKDLQDMLSNCCNLKWLSIVRCHLYDELKVNGPLPHLLYLYFSFCEITKIALHAVKLTNFVYKGKPVCIDLGKSSKLESADIRFYRVTLEDATTQLANVFTHVQILTFDACYEPPQIPCLVHKPCMFSQLRHLKLMLLFESDVDTLNLVSFLMSAPFIEILEMDLIVSPFSYTGHVSLEGLVDRPYKHLKNVCMTAFRGSRGQLEFLLHIVENAPALGFLTIDHTYKQVKHAWKDAEKEVKFVDLVHGTARRYLEGKISSRCSLRLV
ncbi:F-box/FBD/LRR-repeat protein At3g14710-like [Hordeum vulgare subsp. vulgare]|uniref:F-box domain-containing protein n=1 Tax=Hordeum vulgare subsp. vulgare TaxID=112509 RepID=A0A8I6XK10_HORVV|nr:F-box/FBD/LRR-repeat protein At3g14710-like [Hordeum vulgare subsp. vulgare]